MPASYSISGPTTGPIVVPRSTSWETLEWSWAFWYKCRSGAANRVGVFSTSLAANGTTAGVDIELFSDVIHVDLLGQQYPIAIADDGAWHHYAFCFDATD